MAILYRLKEIVDLLHSKDNKLVFLISTVPSLNRKGQNGKLMLINIGGKEL